MKVSKHITSVLGLGYSPFAPGTVGALFGILLIYSINLGLTEIGVQYTLIIVVNLVMILTVLIAGVFAIGKVHKEWTHDASQIVIDEVVGVWIAILFLPLHWKYYLYGFILFRFFDITKPLFIRRLDKLNSNWSVMLDDVLAGLYSNIIILVLINFNIL